MRVIPPCRTVGSLAAVLAACWCLGACTTVTDTTKRAVSSISPYKVEVVQGNFVSKEQVEALKPGMSRQQVREILGTSLLTDVFHENRWDYVFTIRRQGVEPLQRRLTLYFNGEALERFQGDAMPSEEEFVAQLDARRGRGKVPDLQITDEQLKKLTPAQPPKTDGPSVALPPLPPSYPPLESTTAR